MAKYTFVCDMDHDPMTFEVEADNDDQAMTDMIAQIKPHGDEKHPDLMKMSEEDLKKMIMDKWTKTEDESMPMAA